MEFVSKDVVSVKSRDFKFCVNAVEINCRLNVTSKEIGLTVGTSGYIGSDYLLTV